MSYYGYLAHHGIKGMKWGVRRYENPDGTLTEAGKERYSKKRYDKLKKERTGWATGGAIAAVSLIPVSLLTIPSTGGVSIPLGVGGGLAVAAVAGAVDKLYDIQMSEIKKKNPSVAKQIEKENKKPQIKVDNKKWDKLNSDLTSGKITQKEYEKLSSELWKKERNLK